LDLVSITEPLPIKEESIDEVYRSFADLSSKTLLPQILDAIPNVCIILNRGNQIVFANRVLMQMVGTTDRLSICGLKPGEALRCTHSAELPDGCGTTESCETCGALNALVDSRRGHEATRECRIVKANGEMLDLRVWTTPITVEEMSYTVMTLTDVSDEKRRRALERVFFHDILNTAGALRGFCELLIKRPLKERDKLRDRILLLSTRLIEEIVAQKELTEAENGELNVSVCQMASGDLLAQVTDQFVESDDPDTVAVTFDPASERVTFTSDPALLRRVIGNLVKNAVEASRPGETVTVGSYRVKDKVEVRIHNEGSIPRKTQLQIFHRSFSTKGVGRGLGTYSAKLITERYLKGEITFTSTRESGTTFSVAYPLIY
jgi:signal transduction histidine kinase